MGPTPTLLLLLLLLSLPLSHFNSKSKQADDFHADTVRDIVTYIYIYIYRERERERERISTRIERYGGSFNGGCCPRGGEAISGDTKAIAIPSRGGGGSIKSCWKRSRRWTVGRAGQGFSVSDMHADDQRRVSHSLRPQLLLHVHRHPSSPQERLPLLFTAPHHPQLVPQLLARQGSFSTKS